MNSVLSFFIRAAWMTAGLVWAVAATHAKRTVRSEPLDSRIGHLMTFGAAFALLFSRALRVGALAWQAIPCSALSGAVGVALTMAGVAFAIGARFYLGDNWNWLAAIQQQHTLVRTGPYTVVRHPIYAGLLLAMLGTAIAQGDLASFVAVPIALAGWLAKARREEYLLLAEFGDAYAHYRRQVKALVPFVM